MFGRLKMADLAKTRVSTATTPLWVISLFVTLTEVMTGVAATQTSGGVQVALTAFVITFPLLIASAFFWFLWSRPHHLYSPSEYQGTEIRTYVDAMVGPVKGELVQVETRQALQESELNALEFAVKGILTKHDIGPLTGLNGPDPVLIRYEPDLYSYLQRLDGLDFIQPNKGYGLYDIEQEHRGDERCPYEQRPLFDLKKYVYITDEGKKYLDTLNDFLRKAKERGREGSRTGAGS
jgi:hypothetical protein